jgi:hypothetical protein
MRATIFMTLDPAVGTTPREEAPFPSSYTEYSHVFCKLRLRADLGYGACIKCIL